MLHDAESLPGSVGHAQTHTLIYKKREKKVHINSQTQISWANAGRVHPMIHYITYFINSLTAENNIFSRDVLGKWQKGKKIGAYFCLHELNSGSQSIHLNFVKIHSSAAASDNRK